MGRVDWWDGLDGNQKGRIAELKVHQRAIEREVMIARVEGGARYDFVIGDARGLHRVQVKWAGRSKTPGAAVASLTTWAGNARDSRVRRADRTRQKMRRYTKDEIDAILVYVAPLDCLCWFEGVHIGKQALQIRYAPTRNNQSRRVLYAEDFRW